ncbi:MAG: MATE family efflux transporter [Novosphingobium sp.]
MTAASPFRAELRATLAIAGPLALANLLQMAIGATDVIFVARLGQESLAASALSVSIFMLISWALSGLTGAVAPLISAERGAGRHAVREIRRSMRMALWLAVISGGLAMTVGGFGETIMLATGQQPGVAAKADRFLDIICWAIPPMIAANVLRTFVSAMGRPIFATAITALAILVNALANWAFIYGHFGLPAMGLEGSAFATVVTGVATVLAYVAAIRSDRHLRRYHLFGRWWRPEWQRLRDILRIGLPIALIVVAEGGFFSAAGFLMGRIGAAELAGHTIALQIAALTFQVPFGVGQAATIRAGFHYGARDRAGIGRAGWAAVIVAFGFSFVAAAVMVLFPRAVLGIYVQINNPANAVMVGLAMQYLLVAAAFQLFDGIQAVAAGLLRGLQDTRVPMVMALFGYWIVGFGTAIWLGFYTPWAGIGVWIGLAVGLVATSALLLWRWHRREALSLVPA